MGTGEVGRYLGTLRLRPGRQGRLPRLARAVPAQDRRQPRPASPQRVFDGIDAGRHERPLRLLHEFYQDFYNPDENLGTRISEEAVRGSWNVAAGASWYAVAGLRRRPGSPTSAPTSPKIDVPALIVHGTADRILPIDATGRPFHKRAARPPTTSRSRAPRTACSGPTPTRSTTALLAFLAK